MNSSLLSMLQLSDPALPIGGYAHSSVLETYVQKGIVRDKKSAHEFIKEMISTNLHFTDAAFMSLSYDAAEENNYDSILQYDEECAALKLPREMRIASQKLGMRLMKIFQPICNSEIADRYKRDVDAKFISGHYCIVFGLYAQALKIPKEEALTGFYYNAAAGMVTNSVKLVPLGQQDGQEILFSLQPLIGELVMNNLTPDKTMLGLCCNGFDIRCMQHEQLYSRLYMS